MNRKFAMLAGMAAIGVAALPATASAQQQCNDVLIFSGIAHGQTDPTGLVGSGLVNAGFAACGGIGGAPTDPSMNILTPGATHASVGVLVASTPRASGPHTLTHGGTTTPIAFSLNAAGTRWNANDRVAIDYSKGGPAVASITLEDGSVITNTYNSVQGMMGVTSTTTKAKARKAKKARRTRR